MSARELYEGVLIEINKDHSSNILLEDFNFWANKAINNYTNKRYNIYDVNQQSTDDLRVLKATAMLKPIKVNDYAGLSLANGANYEVIMPSDYLHLLNCICEYKVLKPFKCYDANTYVQFPAERLTADSWSTVINNVYTRPTYKRPYYYIHNVNRDLVTEGNNQLDYTSHHYNGTSGNSEPTKITAIPTDPYGPDIKSIGTTFKDSDSYGENIISEGKITDKNGNFYANDKSTEGGVSRVIDLRNTNGEGFTQVNAVEKIGQVRYGNPGNVRIEIRYGKDNSLFQLERVYVDYIKAPQHIRLS